ncbi:C40 family peptidase [Streptomyces sp.]|uniref:C40 family peptidase n=1 Tax=Streptomyces sp. TaxID=1931 RepID=UPI002F421DCA
MTRLARGWLRSAVVCGVLLGSAALSLPAAQRAGAQPYDPLPAAPIPLSDLLAQLQTLYRQTESASESYNQATVIAAQTRAKAARIDGQLAQQRMALAASRDEAGLMARLMYQDGGVSPYLSMLAGRSPQDFFGQRHVLARAAGHQNDVLRRLADGEARLKDLNAQAQRTLDRAQHAQSVQAARKTAVETHLRQVEAVLAGLTGVQIAELQALEEKGVNKAQRDLLDSKALGSDPALRAPSKAGDRAIAYAFLQLGKPYVWGAEGPGAFDCSGLTSQAWAHAGVTIPRTSQEQWARLPHVPLALLRPGDLVVYFPGATHVALYIGDGLVIQAPRPGSYVKVSPLAVNPILGAVRPDPGDRPLPRYTPRPVPPQAKKPTPIGVPAPQPPARTPGPPPGHTPAPTPWKPATPPPAPKGPSPAPSGPPSTGPAGPARTSPAPTSPAPTGSTPTRSGSPDPGPSPTAGWTGAP